MSQIEILVVAVLAVAGPEPLDMPSVLTPLELKYTGGGYRDRVFRYRLYVPKQAEGGSPLPMVVWLHGLSQAGSNNIAQMKGLDRLILRGQYAEESYPFFILAPQCPADNRRWSPCEDPKTQDDMIDVAAAMIKEVLAKYPVDETRVSVTGLSSGGNGCWEIAARYPELFSAVAPHGATANLRSMDALKDVPLWTFHSVNDNGAPIDIARIAMSRLQHAGGRAHLTEIPASEAKRAYYEGHDCWTAAFHDYGLLEWMLAQQRGNPSWWNGPGHVTLVNHVRYYTKNWSWWQLAIQAALPALVVGAIWKIVRQRRALR